MGGLSPSTDPGARPARSPVPPPGTGARPSACHRRALLYPAAPAAFHPAQEPGGLLRPALLRPPCACRPRPARLSRRHALWRPAAAPSRFQFFFLRGDQRETGADARLRPARLRPARLLPPVFSPFFLKGTRADMPAAPFFPRGFSKGKGEKTEQSGRRPRAAGQGGFFRRATGKGKRSGVSAR